MTTLLISCCLICHRERQLVEFLKLAASSAHTQRSTGFFAYLVCFSDFSFLDSFLCTSGHWSRMEYWMLSHFHFFFRSLQFFIFCVVHVQPFFFSFDVETSFCLCSKGCVGKILKFVAQLPLFPRSSGLLSLLYSLAVCPFV